MEKQPKDETPAYPLTEEETKPLKFEHLASLVKEEFEVEEALVEFNVPTFYVKLQRNSKQAFLRLLNKLKPEGYIPLLRRKNGKTLLKITAKPEIKPSNPMVNLILLLVTILTTFATGYIISLPLVEEGLMQNPLIGALSFSVAILAILGAHEMGHKIAANSHRVEATLPYFIPGPPPLFGWFGIGTFGAVIMQKSLPPNRDALYDIGVTGPVVGFITTIIVTAVGILFSYPVEELPSEAGFLPVIPLFIIILRALAGLGLLAPGKHMLVHPVALAGWVGMFITMLNLLPAAMLDGGHIARCFASEKLRLALSVASIVFLLVIGLWPMAFFVLFMSMFKHPGPLDDVSGLSFGRKLFSIFIVLMFLSCIVLFGPLLDLFLWLMSFLG